MKLRIALLTSQGFSFGISSGIVDIVCDTICFYCLINVIYDKYFKLPNNSVLILPTSLTAFPEKVVKSYYIKYQK